MTEFDDVKNFGKAFLVKPKILSVIGASGLVGSSIVKEALSKGYKVNGTLREKNNIEKTKFLKQLPNAENLRLHSAEMLNKATLLDPLVKADAVFICCLIPTYKGFDGTPARELDYDRGYNEIIMPTVNGCLNILEAANKNGIKNVLICSSTSSTNPVPLVKTKNEIEHWSDEEEQCRSNKFTSAAKTVMEKAALDYCAKNKMRVVIFLPTGLYGKGVLPEHLNHNPFLWIKRVIDGGNPRHDKTPNDSASMIHLEDLAQLFLSAYENPSASGRYFGVLESFHWKDIYAECKKNLPKMKMPQPLTEDPVEPTQFDFARRDSLGIKLRDFPTIMKETIDWLKSRPFND